MEGHLQAKPFAAQSAGIIWRDGMPLSQDSDDGYFSRQGHPLAESKQVFVDAIDLPSLGEQPSIGELGFGFGLNFALTCASLTQQSALHYLAFEWQMPSQDDLQKFWEEMLPPSDGCPQLWQAAIDFGRRMALRLGPRPDGAQRLRWSLTVPGNAGTADAAGQAKHRQIHLTLLHGDLRRWLKGLPEEGHSVDAWYLDGFAPAKNPQAWEDEAIQLVSRRSHPGSRLASFSAAGQVRRSLANCGWQVTRHKGYGQKRHQISAIFSQDEAGDACRDGGPDACSDGGLDGPDACDVVIVGAGLAGLCLAHRLSLDGLKVVIIERGSASQAWHHPAPLLHPHWGDLANLRPQHEIACWQFTSEQLAQPHWPQVASNQGVVELLPSPKRQRQAARLFSDSAASQVPAAWIGQKPQIIHPAILYWPDAQCIDGNAFFQGASQQNQHCLRNPNAPSAKEPKVAGTSKCNLPRPTPASTPASAPIS